MYLYYMLITYNMISTCNNQALRYNKTKANSTALYCITYNKPFIVLSFVTCIITLYGLEGFTGNINNVHVFYVMPLICVTVDSTGEWIMSMLLRCIIIELSITDVTPKEMTTLI